MFQFYQIDAEPMLAHELETLGLDLLESNVPNVGLGIFVAKPFGPEEIIGTYYGSVHYENIPVGTRARPKVYDGGIMAV